MLPLGKIANLATLPHLFPDPRVIERRLAQGVTKTLRVYGPTSQNMIANPAVGYQKVALRGLRCQGCTNVQHPTCILQTTLTGVPKSVVPELVASEPLSSRVHGCTIFFAYYLQIIKRDWEKVLASQWSNTRK